MFTDSRVTQLNWTAMESQSHQYNVDACSQTACLNCHVTWANLLRTDCRQCAFSPVKNTSVRQPQWDIWVWRSTAVDISALTCDKWRIIYKRSLTAKRVAYSSTVPESECPSWRGCPTAERPSLYDPTCSQRVEVLYSSTDTDTKTANIS